MLKALERLNEELSRTGVISGDFKSGIRAHAQSVATEAFENGRKQGLKEAKESEPKALDLLRQWAKQNKPPCVCTHMKKCIRCKGVELLAKDFGA